MGKYHYNKSIENTNIISTELDINHIKYGKNEDEIEANKEYFIANSNITINAPKDRVILLCDLNKKNWHSLGEGLNFKLNRDIEQLNYRIKNNVNGIVVSDNGKIPKGAEVIFNYLCLHDVNRIFGLDEDIEFDDVHYYSIMESDCYIWRENKDQEWQSCLGYCLAEKVFTPYKGSFIGVEPTELKDYAYITSGDLKGKVVKVLKGSLYEMVFQQENNREGNIIRIRHWDNEFNEREEIVAISHELTDQVNKGELLVGLTPSKAKTYNKNTQKWTKKKQ
jgi:hypothetical protein